MTITPSLMAKPSISTSSWFSVCSRSSWPPPMPAPLWRPTASISSMNTIAGADFFAWEKRSRTFAAPMPTNISTNAEPEMLKNGTFASPATAFAMSVLPVPGGPTSRTPLGILAPIALKRCGERMKSTISLSSSFSSSAPATSLNVMPFAFGSVRRARLLPKLAMPLPLPVCARMMKNHKTATSPIITIVGSHSIHQGVGAGSFVSISKA
ncbi:MAG: hypothetical protein BWY81_01582 [Firmicutes bacterium ADurb.Bin467]|nr:MAG: hypothetical protein BWY81_01582 [Firmicutes bacterium ADurb.Bin467]